MAGLFSITQSGVDDAIFRYIQLSKRPTDWALNTIAREVPEHVNSHFNGSNPLGWKALKPSTVAAKARGLGGFSGNPSRILWHYGRLGRGTKGLVLKGLNTVKITNPWGYGIYHMTGTRNMVARPWFVIQQFMRDRIREIIMKVF